MPDNLKKLKLPQISPEFYCAPDTFSFKDLLAVLFTIGFFYACFRALNEPQALELVKSISYLMAVILGGYFGHEITAVLVREKNKNTVSGDPNYYGGGVYADGSNPNNGNKPPV